tara:strand:- start:37 stop:207 length:171 start_codon:yes stop_codon:yes gene_type:complete
MTEQKLIENAILNKQKEFITSDGNTVTLPSPQGYGSIAQRKSYASKKAKQIFENIK